MTRRLPLSQGKVALVDDQDFEWLNQWNWTYSPTGRTGYAYRNVYQNSQYVETVYMHRAILKPPLGMESDHINGDGLDNRRCNLRICTHAQNLWNSRKRKGMTSQYKGVSWRQKQQYWVAAIVTERQYTHLGCFDNEKEAAIAYNYAARELHGNHARLNPVPDRSPLPPQLRKQRNKTSRYVGVSWSRKNHCWRAEIRVNYKLIWLGHFDSEEEAARIWNAAALKHRGAGARLNILPKTKLRLVCEQK